MHQIDKRIRNAIDLALSAGNEIVIVAYSLLDSTEHMIRYILSNTFSRFGLDELNDPVFSSIKELTTNAIKANIKTILINEGTIENPSDPYEVVHKIKSVLNEKALMEYGIKCKETGLSIRLHLIVTETELIARIVDPSTLTEEQEKRIGEKIERAKGYDDLAICYLENPDPLAEGMGLGLSMVVVLLKGSGIDPGNFTIVSDAAKDKTIAQIRVPLSKTNIA